MFLTAVRHEVNNLESSVVVQELELAINLALWGLYKSGRGPENIGTPEKIKIIFYFQLEA